MDEIPQIFLGIFSIFSVVFSTISATILLSEAVLVDVARELLSATPPSLGSAVLFFLNDTPKMVYHSTEKGKYKVLKIIVLAQTIINLIDSLVELLQTLLN